MAVLKDLIVHGPSRFINGINANSIKADEGIFNQLIAVDLKATDATIENLTATNARVTQTLTANHISTNTWEAANIANVGGNFYISPTGEQSGTINVTITRTAAPGTDGGTYTLTFGSTSPAGFGVSSTSAAYWGPSAKVMATGEVSYNNSKRYPLGTCDGTVSGNVTASNNNITAITIAGVKSEALDVLFTDMGIAITASSGSLSGCVGYKLRISLYERYSSSSYYPIGILLTSLGRNDKKQYIDIYNGAVKSGRNAADNANLNTGMAEPALRIGQLDGLPNIVDNGTSETLPSGWGIYTTNGFFKGKIVANAGRIGNWTIESNAATYGGAIYNGTFGSSGGVFITPSYTNSTAIGGSSGSKNWTFTAGNTFGITKEGALYASSGKIGGWTIDANKIYSGTHSTWNSTAEDGLYLGNDGIAGGNGGIWYLWKDGSAKIGAMELSEAGVLTVPAANVSGALTAATISADKLTAGTINSSILTANNIVTDTITMGTAGSNSYIYVSKNNKSTAINSETKNWRIILGNVFGVSEAGYLTASSGKIGGFNLTTNAIYSTTNALGTTANNVYLGTEGISLGTTFKVTKAGELTATGASLKSLKIYDTNGYLKGDFTNSTIYLYGGQSTTATYPQVLIDPTEGITIAQSNTYKAQIKNTGMQIYANDSTNAIASFSENIRIGANNNKHITIDSTGLNIWTGPDGSESADDYQIAKIGLDENGDLDTRLGLLDEYHTIITNDSFVINDGTGAIFTVDPSGATTTGEATLMRRPQRKPSSGIGYSLTGTIVKNITYTIRLYNSTKEDEPTNCETTTWIIPSNQTAPMEKSISKNSNTLQLKFNSEGRASLTRGRLRATLTRTSTSIDFHEWEIVYTGQIEIPKFDFKGKVYASEAVVSYGRCLSNTGSGYGVWIGRGISNNEWTSNRGVFDVKTNTWLIRRDDDNKTQIPRIYSTSVSGRNVYVNADGIVGYNSSSKRWKEDIRKLIDHQDQKIQILNGIKSIKPVLFKYREDIVDGADPNVDMLGLIAEDVYENLPIAAYLNDEDPNLVDGWSEPTIITAILLLAQEVAKENEELKTRIERLEAK